MNRTEDNGQTKARRSVYANLPMAEVDRLADDLVDKFNNPDYRAWYCQKIYKFGLDLIEVWRDKAMETGCPGKYFSKYVSEKERQVFGEDG